MSKRKKIKKEGEQVLPFGLSVESLKRAHFLNASLEDLGFPSPAELEVEKNILEKSTHVLVNGELRISC